MTCTVAAVIAFLGYMPPKGTEIVVPKSAIAQLTITQRLKARVCARRYGIRWRVDETR